MWLWKIRKTIRLSLEAGEAEDEDCEEETSNDRRENKNATLSPEDSSGKVYREDRSFENSVAQARSNANDSNSNRDEENAVVKPINRMQESAGVDLAIRKEQINGENVGNEDHKNNCPSSCRVTVHHHHHHHHFYLHHRSGDAATSATTEYKGISVDGGSVENSLPSRLNPPMRKDVGVRLPLIKIAGPNGQENGETNKASFSQRLHTASNSSPGGILFSGPSNEALPPIPKNTAGRFVTLGAPNATSSPSSDPSLVESLALETAAVDKEKTTVGQKTRKKRLKRGNTRERFLKSLRHVHRTGNFSTMQRFYSHTFSSFNELMAVFKTDPESPGVDFEAWHPSLREDILEVIHDALGEMPQAIHKTVLKSVIIALLKDKELEPADEVRGLFILIQNPIFAAQSSYTVYAHLLRQIVNLSSVHKQIIIQWFRGMGPDKLRMIVRNTIQFINVRQFPPSSRRHLPTNSSSRWWIPTAAKALSLISAANDLSTPSPCYPTFTGAPPPTAPPPPPPLHYTDLYNTALDHMDLMKEFSSWQSNSRIHHHHGHHFTFCQYPFMLSIVAKRIILTKDSEQQMVQTARRSIEAKGPFYRYRYRYQPQMDLFFLNIRIRRSHLVTDSLNEIATKQQDLKKKLKVSFVGEPGLDMGGLAKEWLLLLIRHIFEPDYGMFVYHPNSRCYWFSTSAGTVNSQSSGSVENEEDMGNIRRNRSYSNSSSSSSEDSPRLRSRASSYESHIMSQNKNLREYNLIGVLMGLAVYNSITLDLHFPSICYRKLLSPPVAPWGEQAEEQAMDDHQQVYLSATEGDSSDEEQTEYNGSGDESAFQEQAKITSSFSFSEGSQARNIGGSSKLDKVGLVEEPSIEALAEIMPDVARGLSELLAYEGDVEEDMCMNFQVSLEEYGEVRTYDIKDGGGNIPVTNENRREYVALYLDWILNTGIYHQFRAFYLGFHSVCDSNALLLLRPEEVEMLVCGSPTIDLRELQKVTEYDGYNEDDPVIRDFWEVLESLPLELQKKFLHFTTGSDRVPVGGMSEMPFKITKLPPIPSNGFVRIRRRIGGARGSRQNEGAWDTNSEQQQEEQLPEAHTCFNQLVLPPYRSQETLRQKLIIAISNAEGFGLE